MPVENKVVITTSIVVKVKADETGNSRRLESIVRRFQEAISNAFKRSDRVEPSECVAFDWLNDPETNFGRCADCKRLVSDCEKPNQIRGLIDAKVVNGDLLCPECAYFRREKRGHKTDD